MKRALFACLLGLPWSALALAAATATNQAQPAAAELYRCRSADGAIALVSKPDPTMHDCVRVWNGNAATEQAPAPVPAPIRGPAPQPESAQGDAPRWHAETAEEHEARLRSARDGVMQWCQDHQNSKTPAKVKAKQLTECVQDKFGTYLLLYP